ARRRGSAVHDEIYFGQAGFERRTNNAGGTEGGMSSGAPLVVRTAFKPLSALMSPPHSVDIAPQDEAPAGLRRSRRGGSPGGGGRGHRGVGGRVRRGRGLPREVRRRPARRDPSEPRGVSRAGAELLRWCTWC